MKLLRAVLSGFAGACAMTLAHQTARKLTPNAPRLDVLGMRAIVRALRGLDQTPPRGKDLYDLAFAADLASNTALFTLVGVGGDNNSLAKGALLGAGAGLATATLPPALGLGHQPGEDAPKTQILTVAWYLLGGLTAALTFRVLQSRSNI